jgi:diguanylate cyclase (GGDEF)-like protein/PAS domain S-box-containing protein
MDVSALRMREATITAGLWLTLGVGALGELYVALTWERPHRFELAVLFALATVTGILISLLPRERIVRSSWREPFFLSWTMSDFVLLVLATLADGGTSSPLVLVFFIPVVFSAMSYPLASVLTVGAASVLSYLLLALSVGGSSAAYEAAFAVALACTAAMSAWQAQNHKRQHWALAAVSRTDPLTGCLNRRGFEERALAEIGAMSRSGSSGAILVLDIDHFKLVNDMFGHAAGDDLLCWVSRTLEQVVRSADSVGRLGGDEFAVLLTEIDARLARAGARRILEALQERAPASLGLAVFPDEDTDLEGLIRRADARLYETRQGRLGDAHALPARRPMPAETLSSAAADEPDEGFREADVWKAALDAMPHSPGNGDRPSDSKDLQAALLDQLDAAVLVTDMTGCVLSWNSGAELLYGWTSQEAVGRSARELVVPDDGQAAERLVLELRRSGRWDGELAVRRKDGSTFTAYVRNRLILDENGGPSAIVGVAVDISERIAAETELLQSRNYVQAVTECIGDGLLTLDVDGRLTYANRSAETMLGWPDGELVGEAIVEVIYAPCRDGSARPFEECPIAPALSQEATVRVEDDVFRTRGGRELPVAYTAAPFHTEAGLQGCVVIFQDITERKLREGEQRRDAATLACINRVEDALAEDRFVLYAQPIVDLRSGETVQHELLLRMRERDGTIVLPGEFLPAAERYALIGEIDWWVIKQATRLAGEGSPVELNLSARSVVDLDVVEHIERCVAQHAVPPGRMVFEITETAIVEDPRAARRFAERMHAMGFKVALDDFGTGYGTLTYLKQIPVDYLKLDIEFVADLLTNSASRHVVQAVVALARDFQIQTVAEGAEDAGTLELLSDLGVDLVQGYHLARPEPFAERPGDQSAPVQTRPRSVRRPEPRRAFPRRRPAHSRMRS